MKLKQIQISAILLTLRLSASRLVFYGSKQMLNDETQILSFTCYSERRTETNYAEFLVNKKSVASSIYSTESEECNFMNGEKDCKNICRCFSDGKTYSWTFPLPSSKVATLYSCQMFIDNQNTPEQAHLLYNGTDFKKKTEFRTNSSSISTKGLDFIGDEEKDVPIHEESSNIGVYAMLTPIIVLLLVLIGIILWINRKKGSRGAPSCIETENSGREDVDGSESPMLTINQLNRAPSCIETENSGAPSCIETENSGREDVDGSESPMLTINQLNKPLQDKSNERHLLLPQRGNYVRKRSPVSPVSKRKLGHEIV